MTLHIPLTAVAVDSQVSGQGYMWVRNMQGLKGD